MTCSPSNPAPLFPRHDKEENTSNTPIRANASPVFGEKTRTAVVDAVVVDAVVVVVAVLDVVMVGVVVVAVVIDVVDVVMVWFLRHLQFVGVVVGFFPIKWPKRP